MLFPAVMLVLAGLIYLSINSPIIAIGAIGALTYSIILAKTGLWRTMMGTSILISVLRSGPPGSLLSEGAWYVLQFGPILIAWLAILSKKPDHLRRSDRNVVLYLTLFAVAALATNLTSLAPSSTLPQSLLLVGMSGFLAFTYTRRWTSEDSLRGDVAMVFVVVTAIQLAGVAPIFVGQSWPFDPDYGRYRGLFSNANYAGMMSAIGIAVGIYLLRVSRRGKLAVVISMAVLAVGMLMSGSRGALVALGTGIVVLMLSRSGRKVVVALVSLAGAGVIFAALIYPQFFDALDKFFLRDAASADITSGRLDIYAAMLRLFQLSPFTGTGFRTVEVLSPASSGLAGHNIYLTVLTETGLFGAFFFVCLAIAVVSASGAGKAGRPLLLVVVTVAAAELTESSIYGWGGPTAISAWLLILAFAANGRFLKDKPAFVDGLMPSKTPSEILPKRLLASSRS